MSRATTEEKWTRAEIHRQKRIAKLQRIAGKSALLAMWEERLELNHNEADHQYVVALRARLRSAENQLNAMRP